MKYLTLGIILSIASILGVYISLIKKGVFHRVISMTLALSVLVGWIRIPMVLLTCLCLLIIGSLMAAIYGCIASDIDPLTRFSIVSIGIVVGETTVFKIQHWPGATLFDLLSIVPVMTYLFRLFRQGIIFTKEMSFMLILSLLSIFEIMKLWQI